MPQNSKLKTQNFLLGFSPCPNDTFMFDALVNGKIDTGELSFNVQLADIETLNQKALKGELDITKISFGVYSGEYLLQIEMSNDVLKLSANNRNKL